ncbi:MAG: adenosylhomocysteinase [Clostridiales bacterium]|nr:adenosylhomocysteinase [Clostridiales bacterium]
MSIIRDPSLAPEGKQKIDWAKANMPILRGLEQEFGKTRPFAGLKMTVSIHLEAKTAYLAMVLAAGGAQVAAAGSNPLSTQDDVAAALADCDGIDVYAWHDQTAEEYQAHLEESVAFGPHIILDDGGDLVNLLHTKRRDLLPRLLGGCEETTTGIMRLVAMEKDGVLAFPMIAVNDAMCKHLFDNRYGTGQSVWDGINRTTNLIVCGKTVVVAGYGWCGKGVAMRAKGLGAKVVVTEIDPIKVIEAHMDGFETMRMAEAAPLGDIFITVTGCKDVITREHFPLMKNEAVLCNAGHFDCEVSRTDLEEICVSRRERRRNIVGYTLQNGKTLNLLAGGRLVNLAAGDGHAAEIMDMSFAIQALSALYLVKNKDRLENRLIPVPKEIDDYVAGVKLSSLGISYDTLTEEQAHYLAGWTE